MNADTAPDLDMLANDLAEVMSRDHGFDTVSADTIRPHLSVFIALVTGNPTARDQLRDQISTAIGSPDDWETPEDHEGTVNAVMEAVAHVVTERDEAREALEAFVAASLQFEYNPNGYESPGYDTDAEERAAALANIVEMHRLLVVRAGRRRAARAERDTSRELIATLRQDETRLHAALGLPEDTDFDAAIAHATTVVRDLARVTNRKQFAEGEVTRLRCALMERHAEYLAHSCSNFPTTPPIAFVDLSRPLRKETPDA